MIIGGARSPTTDHGGKEGPASPGVGPSACLEALMARKPDTPCSICGELTWSGSTSAPTDQRVCRPCRQARGSQSNGARLTANCVVCGMPFAFIKAGGTPPMTCPGACRCALRRQAAASPRGPRPCVDCSTPVVKVGLAVFDPCAKARRTAYYQAKNRRRRALKRGASSEPYTLAEIAARDKHRCQLCRRKVNMKLKAPHPKSPTVDHVIPIVENGDDTRANVQLAHFGCNSSKGSRGSQQLALVG